MLDLPTTQRTERYSIRLRAPTAPSTSSALGTPRWTSPSNTSAPAAARDPSWTVSLRKKPVAPRLPSRRNHLRDPRPPLPRLPGRRLRRPPLPRPLRARTPNPPLRRARLPLLERVRDADPLPRHPPTVGLEDEATLPHLRPQAPPPRSRPVHLRQLPLPFGHRQRRTGRVRFREWGEDYERLWEARLVSMTPEEREQAVWEREEDGNDDHLESEAHELAHRRYHALLEPEGAADWVDEDENYQPEVRRRKGALALLDLLSRCRRLASVEFDAFDFGGGPGLEGDPSFPRHLTSLTDLKFAMLNVHDFFLPRAPNLLRLAIPNFPKTNPHVAVIPKLHRLSLTHLPTINHVKSLLTSIVGASTMRHLRLRMSFWDVQAELLGLLLHTPLLESLSVTHYDVHGMALGSPRELDARLVPSLEACTKLRHLEIPWPLPHPLFYSLPPSLISLSTTSYPQTLHFGSPRPPPASLTLTETLEALVDSQPQHVHLKRFSRVRLKKFSLVDCADELDIDDGFDVNHSAVTALTEAAEEVGLEVLLVRAGRRGESQTLGTLGLMFKHQC